MIWFSLIKSPEPYSCIPSSPIYLFGFLLHFTIPLVSGVRQERKRHTRVNNFCHPIWSLDRETKRSDLPKENISQSKTPKDHTSLWIVYTLSKIVSGAIHFKGRRAYDGERQGMRTQISKGKKKSFVPEHRYESLLWEVWILQLKSSQCSSWKLTSPFLT
jgi:hypothetical protein